MATIDELGRRAAAELLAELEREGNSARALARITTGAPPPARDRGRGSSRGGSRRLIALASAALVLGGLAGVVTVRDWGSPATVTNAPAGSEVTPPPSAATAAAQPTAPTTVVAIPSTPATPAIAVSYLDPPPLFDPQPFASLQLSSVDTVSLPAGFDVPPTEVAVTPTGAVVVDGLAGTATVVDWSGIVTATVDLAVVPVAVVAGPGDVLYGMVQGPGTLDLAMVAVALSGPSAGEVIASAPISIVAYSELPVGTFGHGPTGIIDRVRDVGAQLIGYVDVDGSPLTLETAALVTIDDASVVRMEGGPTWPLEIERDVAGPSPYAGPRPPAQTGVGEAVFVTAIGGAIDPADDYSERMLPVIVDLHADGTGTWWGITDGWGVGSSDVGGTILVRQVDRMLELARFPSAAPAVVVEPSENEVLDIDVAPWAFDLDLDPCVPEVCPSIAATGNGVVVAFDTATSTFQIGQDGSSPPRTVTLTEPLGGRGAYLVTIGPDDVAYLAVRSTTSPDSVGDLLAVSLTGANDGSVLASARAVVDLSGDSDLVATRSGLVSVGCCGFERPRPDPEAPVVIGWVDRAGNPTVDDGPLVTIEREGQRVDLIRTDPDGSVMRWAIPDAGGIRGMPLATARTDGSVVLAWYDMLTGEQRLFTFKESGTIERIAVPADRSVVGVFEFGVIFFDGAKFQQANLATFTEPTDALATVQGWLGSGAFTTVDAVVDAVVSVLASPDGCDVAPTARVSGRSGNDPVIAIIEHRYGCDDSGAGGNLELTVHSAPGGTWTVSAASWRSLCVRGGGPDFCV